MLWQQAVIPLVAAENTFKLQPSALKALIWNWSAATAAARASFSTGDIDLRGKFPVVSCKIRPSAKQSMMQCCPHTERWSIHASVHLAPSVTASHMK